MQLNKISDDQADRTLSVSHTEPIVAVCGLRTGTLGKSVSGKDFQRKYMLYRDASWMFAALLGKPSPPKFQNKPAYAPNIRHSVCKKK